MENVLIFLESNHLKSNKNDNGTANKDVTSKISQDLNNLSLWFYLFFSYLIGYNYFKRKNRRHIIQL